jgi:AcrR family transcriptional regulator
VAILETSDTPTRILSAAFRRLHEVGYARLSTRDIAAEAGVNHALIHYYFGTKDRLAMAALDEANRRLLKRQSQMYGEPGGFAEKWARARAFYEEDLASGFVRVQMELWAASLSNLALRKEFLPRLLAWRRIVEGGVRDALAHYDLDLPVSAEAIACWIVGFWVGMEFEMLVGIGDEEAHHQEALDAMQLLLERLDAQALRETSHAIDRNPGSARRKGGNDGPGRSDDGKD